MGYDQNRALERLQIVLEPFHCIHIEMVRRFIQQHDICFFKEHSNQIDARLLPAGQVIIEARPHFTRDAESKRSPEEFGFHLISAEDFEAHLQFAIALQCGCIIVTCGHRCFHVSHLGLKLFDGIKGRFHDGLYGHTRRIYRNLIQNGQPLITVYHQRAFLKRLRSGNHMKQRRFAASVFSNQSRFFPGLQLKRYIFQNLNLAEILSDRGKR